MKLLKQKPIKFFALISGVFLFFSMIGIVVYRDSVFGNTSIFEMPVLFFSISITLIILFDVYSVFWMIKKLLNSKKIKYYALPLAGLCIILLFAEKVMLDEIGKEYGTNIEALSEWIMLYVFWGIQLLYNLIIFNMSEMKDKEIEEESLSYIEANQE